MAEIDLDELDGKIAEARAALEYSDDKMREVFRTFSLRYPEAPSTDPWSDAY